MIYTCGAVATHISGELHVIPGKSECMLKHLPFSTPHNGVCSSLCPLLAICKTNTAMYKMLDVIEDERRR